MKDNALPLAAITQAQHTSNSINILLLLTHNTMCGYIRLHCIGTDDTPYPGYNNSFHWIRKKIEQHGYTYNLYIFSTSSYKTIRYIYKILFIFKFINKVCLCIVSLN